VIKQNLNRKETGSSLKERKRKRKRTQKGGLERAKSGWRVGCGIVV
jgi:hypothetical protein